MRARMAQVKPFAKSRSATNLKSKKSTPGKQLKQLQSSVGALSAVSAEGSKVARKTENDGKDKDDAKRARPIDEPSARTYLASEGLLWESATGLLESEVTARGSPISFEGSSSLPAAPSGRTSPVRIRNLDGAERSYFSNSMMPDWYTFYKISQRISSRSCTKLSV